ncbi:response regulator [Curvivirga aplysinae]|uniref:response regulator n=1 Tax=Curvivirga aplysinae TaxID=2529852 RepID=UPI0012BD2E48|nr:response regulator [Curvivirga aplysinae]MTI08270.1 HDOD domain-containing protein [Curvivirga aplysinae]
MSQKPHVLFVDDEENILQGLRRGFRGKRKEWSMSFAVGGKNALEILEDNEIDIIVSDMRMPEMDGAELLEKVKEKSPDTTRIVLSGYAENEAILKVVGPAHQYFAKPCDFEVLERSITRILSLRSMIDEKGIRAKITGLESLPSLPDIFMRVLHTIADKDAHVQEICGLIELDLGLKSQILRISNSAFFGVPQQVTKLETALNLLGLNTIRSLALLEGFFRVFRKQDDLIDILGDLSENSMSIAKLSGQLASKLNLSEQQLDWASSAGALSHIGTLYIATEEPEIFKHASNKADATSKPIFEFEQEFMGYHHAAIGGYILGLWGFPIEICEAVAFHHTPHDWEGEEAPIITCVYFAQLFTQLMADVNQEEAEILSRLKQDSFLQSQLNFDDQDIEAFIQTAIQNFKSN